MHHHQDTTHEEPVDVKTCYNRRNSSSNKYNNSHHDHHQQSQNSSPVSRKDIGTNCNVKDSRPTSPLPGYDQFVTPGGVSVIRNLKSNERLNDTASSNGRNDSTIIQIYNSKESTPVRMRRRSDTSQRRQSATKLWARSNFESSGDMLIGDPSLNSLDIDLNPKSRDNTTITGYINDLCSPVSDSVTNFGHMRDNHLYYHQHLRTNNNATSNLDTIVLSPGAVLKSTSTPSGMQRSFTHDFTTTKTILIPFPNKITDDFVYSLEHVL